MMPIARSRSKRLLLISLVVVLGALAINGERIIRALDQILHPAPANLIIVAPATSDIV
jgi:hypothetical protein